MYLPTFWKLTTEAYGYKLRHMAGWALPAGMFGKYRFRANLAALGSAQGKKLSCSSRLT